MDNTPELREIYSKFMANNQNLARTRNRNIDFQFDIEKIYVETKIRYSGKPPVANGILSSARVQGIKAIKDNRKLIVRGRPGSGKSTFLNHLFFCPKIFAELNHFPILIRLKDFSHSLRAQKPVRPAPQTALEAYIQDLLYNHGIGQEIVLRIIKEGMALILLDGMDEMARQDVGEIASFVGKFSRNRFVISCRSASVQLNLTEFVEVQITDFDYKQAGEFVDHFIRVSSQPPSEDASVTLSSQAIDQIRQLIAHMDEKQSYPQAGTKRRAREEWIEKFAQTPLLLTMLCNVIMRSNRVPMGLLDLYEQSVDLLFSGWDNDRSITRDFPERFMPDSRKDFLAKVAYELHSAEQATISKQEILSIVAPEYREDQAIEEILRYIEESSGIFHTSSKDIYTFRHNTWQEFFAAHYITSSIQRTGLRSQLQEERITDPFWREVYSLVAESFCKEGAQRDHILEYLREIVRCIHGILASDDRLVRFIEHINNTVAKFSLRNKKFLGADKAKLIRAALRVFLFDPDYRHDPTRTLLLELDKSFGNVLVASSFIIRLFCDESGRDLSILDAIEIVQKEPRVERAINADQALEIIYEYVKQKNYRVKIPASKSKESILKIREQNIETTLEEIYMNDSLCATEKAERCRHLCHKHLMLAESYKLRQDDIGQIEQSFSYEKLYASTVLLARSINILERSDFAPLPLDIREAIMSLPDNLNRHLKGLSAY
jgi:hypothetical protein